MSVFSIISLVNKFSYVNKCNFIFHVKYASEIENIWPLTYRLFAGKNVIFNSLKTGHSIQKWNSSPVDHYHIFYDDDAE